MRFKCSTMHPVCISSVFGSWRWWPFRDYAGFTEALQSSTPLDSQGLDAGFSKETLSMQAHPLEWVRTKGALKGECHTQRNLFSVRNQNDAIVLPQVIQLDVRSSDRKLIFNQDPNPKTSSCVNLLISPKRNTGEWIRTTAQRPPRLVTDRLAWLSSFNGINAGVLYTM